MSAMRTFFAIELDEKSRAFITQAIDILKKSPDGHKVRWLKPENIHLTLRFLGNIQASQILTLKLQMQKALRNIPPFRIQLGEVTLFPSPHNPKVVAIDIIYSEMLQKLFTTVEQAVVACGFPPETRPARAHLSIARFRENPRVNFHLDLTRAGVDVLVQEAVLFQSIMERHGARYVPLERLRLG